MRSARVAGPAGQRGALAEELDLGAGAGEVAVAEQGQHVVGLERPRGGGAGVGAEGDDLEAERPAQLDEPVEEVAGLELLDHRGDRVALHLRHPEPRPLPAAEVGHGHDGAVALRHRRVEVLEAVGPEAGVEVGRARAGQPEGLLVVAGVALEGLVDEAAERGARQRGVDAAEVALHLGPPLRGQVAGDAARGARAPVAATGCGQGAGDARPPPCTRGDEVTTAVGAGGLAAAGALPAAPGALGGASGPPGLPAARRAARAGPREACCHTFTNRCTAVTRVRASISQSTAMSSESKRRPTPRAMIRSARSMRPPRASKPSDSALARS